MAAVIDMRAVVKHFGSTVALDGLDLRVEAGEVHAFLGPNGAGKTTTLRILLGLLRIDGGQVQLLGGDPWSDAVSLHKRLAYVPGEVNLWPQLTGGEVIDLLGRLHGGLDDQRRQRYLEMFELDPTKKARAYTKGNRQKVCAHLGTGRRCAAAASRRTHVGAGPSHGRPVPAVRARVPRRWRDGVF
jgi:ABC-2 type transport system ATP-binding protein